MTAVPGEAVELDSAFRAGVARAAAYRWVVPSGRRAANVGWEQVKARLIPPEPRWADDWEPQARHRARMTVVIGRGGRVRVAGDPEGSGDRVFDRSLRSVAEAPMPASPAFPELPTGRDSVVAVLVFGDEATADGTTIRFAAQQSRVRLIPGSLNVVAPRAQGTPDARLRRATVKYDVLETGRVDAASIEILRSSDPELSRAIEQALIGAQFTPAQSNCRNVAQSVVQVFD